MCVSFFPLIFLKVRMSPKMILLWQNYCTTLFRFIEKIIFKKILPALSDFESALEGLCSIYQVKMSPELRQRTQTVTMEQ